MVSLTTLVSIFIFILGLCVGSFLNVLIYRLPRSLPLTGRSFCPKCKKKISWHDNVPLLSFLLLKGRCRACHSHISVQYPVVELVTGVLFIWVWWWVKGWCGETLNCYIVILLYCYIVASLVVIFFIDLKHQIIPDQIIYPAVFISFLYQITNYQLLITNYLITAFVAAFFFLLLHLLTRGRGMGFGDVKLAFLIGLVLGFPKAILAFYLAFLTGAFVGVILILAGKKKFGQHIAFGPYLAASTIITLFWGEQILKWITARFF